MSKLTAFDTCDKEATAPVAAQTRWTKQGLETGHKLTLDLCGHHTRDYGDALAGLGWELHDATPEALESAKALVAASVDAAN